MDALAYSHERGVVHRDIKPTPIFSLSAEGRPFLTDFGIGQDHREHPPHPHGTDDGYPSLRGPQNRPWGERVDARADQYALGITLYKAPHRLPPLCR